MESYVIPLPIVCSYYAGCSFRCQISLKAEMSEVLISARRTESQDAGEISKLVSGATKELFGRKNIAHIM